MSNKPIPIPNELTANVQLTFGHLENVMEWCRQNCNGQWMILEIGRNQYTDRDEYQFDFDNEDDLLIFKLRWGG